jgi:tellurite resistance protein
MTTMTDTVGYNDENLFRHHFKHLPVAFFGSVMGLTGLSVAWRLAHQRFGTPEWIADAFAVAAILAFIGVSTGYAVKIATAPEKVVAEFKHPIAGNLFGTFFISLLLLPILIAPVNMIVARVMWGVAAGAMLVFAWIIVNRWMGSRQQVEHATPAWIVPVVGLLDVPLAVPSLNFTQVHGLMVFALAVGLFFAIPLFTLIFSRLIFESPLPDALKPSLLILVAPFAVGFSAYAVTAGEIDLFASALYMLTLFVLAVLLPRLVNLPRCCPFRVSWWAVSFPLAASAAASLRYTGAHHDWQP